MVDYLFLIPLSPESGENSLRTRLRTLCFDSIEALKSSYLVWYFGDEVIHRPGFKHIQTPGKTKEVRMREAGDMLSKLPQVARRIVRLDDDDPIRPEVFDSVANRDFELAADRYHFFHDLCSGQYSSQKRPWIANTAIHEYRHALTRVPAIGGDPAPDGLNYLFACDHSQTWHKYYRNKKVLYLPKSDPLYIRVLNPGSITAGGGNGNFDVQAYFAYLDRFGDWTASPPAGMERLHGEFERLRTDFFPDFPEYRPKKPRGFWKRWF